MQNEDLKQYIDHALGEYDEKMAIMKPEHRLSFAKTLFENALGDIKKCLNENPSDKTKYMTKEPSEIQKGIDKIKELAKTPAPCGIDEVATAFISSLRVSSWETLPNDFGGYKIGRIMAYILDVLCEKIEDSTAATLRVDVPLYEQCPRVAIRKDEENLEAILKKKEDRIDTLEFCLKLIEKSCSASFCIDPDDEQQKQIIAQIQGIFTEIKGNIKSAMEEE